MTGVPNWEGYRDFQIYESFPSESRSNGPHLSFQCVEEYIMSTFGAVQEKEADDKQDKALFRRGKSIGTDRQANR